METTPFLNDEARDEERSRYFLALFLKVLWSALTLLVVLGILIPLTFLLGWSQLSLPCLLGFLAGISLTAGISTSIRNRALITTLLGVLTLPALAVYVSVTAGSGPTALAASNAVLMPFVAYAAAAVLEGLLLMRLWKTMPVSERHAETGKVPDQDLAPQKEPANHEGHDLRKAA